MTQVHSSGKSGTNRQLDTGRLSNPAWVPILAYHSISHTRNRAFQPTAINQADFRGHLEIIKSLGYVPITLEQYAASLVTIPTGLPSNPIVLTFDDGYQDFYFTAWPFLREYGFTATVFVVTDLIAKTARWLMGMNEAWRPLLTHTQIRELSSSGVEFGSHTCNHVELDILPRAQAQKELTRSRAELENLLQKSVRSLAYPYGYYSAETQDLVREAGYAVACAIKLRSLTTTPDLLATPRYMPMQYMSQHQFRDWLLGLNMWRTPEVIGPTTRIRWELRRQWTRLREYSAGELGRILPLIKSPEGE